MAFHELVDGLVPGSPVYAYARTVPPVSIELSVTEFHDFGKSVQEGLEEREESSKPNDEGYR